VITNSWADGAVATGQPALAVAPLPADHRDLTQLVAQNLRSAIISGRLRPGEFIRIGAAAEALGVSATPIREALVTLRGDGFVESLPNRGFRVMTLSRRDIEDAYLVHRFVAGELAFRAALNLSAEALSRLEVLQEEISRAVEQGDHTAVDEANEQFHRIIYAAGGSPKLSLFLSTALRYVPRAEDADIEGWDDATAHDHKDVLAALQHRNPDRARMAMVAHIEHAKDLLLQHLQSGTEPGPDWPVAQHDGVLRRSSKNGAGR
jgi:DNA-binding GntR family transcriptional regulator